MDDATRLTAAMAATAAHATRLANLDSATPENCARANLHSLADCAERAGLPELAERGRVLAKALFDSVCVLDEWIDDNAPTVTVGSDRQPANELL